MIRGEGWDTIVEERRWEDRIWWRSLCIRETRSLLEPAYDNNTLAIILLFLNFNLMFL